MMQTTQDKSEDRDPKSETDPIAESETRSGAATPRDKSEERNPKSETNPNAEVETRSGAATPSTGKPEPIAMSAVLGTVDALSEAEQIDLYACEEVISTGWNRFVQVGLAFARIGDGELYRVEFNSFDDYCRAKWQYKRAYVYRLISAAQLFTHLSTICRQRQPDHESQLQPLIGLTPDQAVQAWERAVEKADGRKITARLVKAAVQEILPPEEQEPAREPRQTKVEKRRLIDDAIGQLLLLLSQKASHMLLTEKVQTLHAHIQALFPKAKPSAKP